MKSTIPVLKYDGSDFERSFSEIISSDYSLDAPIKIWYLDRFIYASLLELQLADIDRPLSFLSWFNEKHDEKINLLNKLPRRKYNWRNIKRFGLNGSI